MTTSPCSENSNRKRVWRQKLPTPRKREEEALAELEKALAEARLRGQQEVTPPAKEDTAQTEVPPVEPQAEGRIDEDSRAVKTPR